MIDLPSNPGPQSAEVALLDFGVMLTPPLGGPVQRVNRLGHRHRLAVTMPPMQGADARQWKVKLLKGLNEGVRMDFPLLDFSPGAVGNPQANGATAAGSLTLPIKSAPAGYTFTEGQPFSILSGGIHHLHHVQAQAVASGTGTVTLSIYPPLRRATANGNPVDFAKPTLEGFLQGNELSWSMALGNFQGFSFEIHEAE